MSARRRVAEDPPLELTTTMNTAAKPRTARDLATLADFRLGALVCRPSLLVVESGEITEVLEPRIMQVLVALAEHQGEVLSRERLIDLCWSGRVVGDDAIQRCIARLRKLSEQLGGFEVETIRRVGYRLTERASPALAPATEPTGTTATARRAPSTRRTAVAAGATVLFALLAIGAYLTRSPDTIRADAAATIEEIAALVATDQYATAYRLAAPLMGRRHDSALDRLWEQIVLPTLPRIEASGATVSFKPYGDAQATWTRVGTTPLAAPFAAPRGALRIKLEKPGYRTGYFVIANPGPSVETIGPPDTMAAMFLPPVALPLIEDAAPADLVLVPATNIGVTLGAWTNEPVASHKLEMPAFTIARQEVTNREFKEFVDAGGYADPSLWQDLTFRDGDRTLTWEEARARFVDSTGRAGPAGWQLGAYRSGEADLPVSGVSWYEAMAYARFRGAMLPTIHHWMRAAQSPYDALFNTSAAIAFDSRFAADGPVPADTESGLGPWGTLHMAGNVREWVLNLAGERALALGGAWDDYPFSIGWAYHTSPFTRGPQNGLRLMPVPVPLPAEWRAPVTLLYDTLPPPREPVSDEVYEGLRLQFTHTPEQFQENRETLRENDLWSAQLIKLTYASGSTSFVLVLPRGHPQPAQPIIYGPPWGCCIAKRPNQMAIEQLRDIEFLVNGGRALVLPIWPSSYERAVATDLLSVDEAFQRDAALGYHTDAARILDYLETRPEIDAEHAGYVGMSHGASDIGPVVLATEPRIKAAVLISGGIRLDDTRLHAMFDAVNHAPRITVPVLLVNGRFDPLYPYEESQRRLLDLLGTPGDKKKHQPYDAGHVGYPPNSLAREVGDWFDRYLGPPRSAAPASQNVSTSAARD
jgi:DNA-binding winged helix-turn-helix (wHTH) protein/dienelactone hydrolase